MYRLVSWFLLLTLVVAGSVEAASNKTLLTIDGVEYSTQDYRDWWGIWQDPGMVFPATPQGFVDYLLFVEEGRLMEYDLTPGYQRKLEIFLKVRGLAFLKNEEVDRKINITEKQIRKFFADNYAPVWSIQILSYDDQVKAQAVVNDLQAFNGQKAGRLVFADFAGVKEEDGGPLAYEDISVDPVTIAKAKNKQQWLSVLSNLQKGFVAEPFFLADQNRYVVVRMDDINTDLGEEALEKKRVFIERKLTKQAAGELTARLIAKLRKEQHVTVDEELLAKVNLQDDYPEEILKKPVVKMDGFALSVGLFLPTLKDQQALRVGMPEEQLKIFVLDTIISQEVTNQAALNRHYEDRPPLKVVYDFYSDNALRKSFEAGIRARVRVPTEEVESYYGNNQSLYSESARISYVIIQENVDLMNRIDTALSQGADFFDQAQAYSLDAKIKTVEVDKISPALQVELAKLQKGETGAPFALDKGYAILRLINRVEGKRIPLEQVRVKIEGILVKEKFAVAKAAYLAKLRSRSEIAVNQGVWKKLKQEYEK